MANVFIGFDNQADTAVLTQGSWSTGSPRDNLKDYRVKKVARTTNALAASTTFRFALASPLHIAVLALANTNASPDATFRWRLFTDNTFTTVAYDSGTLPVYPQGSAGWSMPWGAANWWTSRPTLGEIARYQRNIIHVLAPWQFGQYGDFQLTDTGNPDGYFQAGRLFVGQGFQPRRNASYGAALALKSRTTSSRAEDGTPSFNVKRPDLSMAFGFDWLAEYEAQKLLDLQAIADLHGEVLMLWDHSDPAFQYRKSLLGRLAQLDPISHPQYATWRAAFQVEGAL